MLGNNKKLIYVHADMDIYEPISCVLENTFESLIARAIVSVGIINNPELLGKPKTFHEF